jgi:hypothetical protein
MAPGLLTVTICFPTLSRTPATISPILARPVSVIPEPVCEHRHGRLCLRSPPGFGSKGHVPSLINISSSNAVVCSLITHTAGSVFKSQGRRINPTLLASSPSDPLLGFSLYPSGVSPPAWPVASGRRSQARTDPALIRQPSPRRPGSGPRPRSNPIPFSVYFFILQICLFHNFQTITRNKKYYIWFLIRKT